jgi:dynein intermediate chain 2
VWDYFYKQNDPTLSLQVDDDGLFSVAMQVPYALRRCCTPPPPSPLPNPDSYKPPTDLLAMQDRGSLVAAGSVDGSVYMLELCEGLATMQQNEKQSVQQVAPPPLACYTPLPFYTPLTLLLALNSPPPPYQMLERESKREKNLETRAKEMRQKEKRMAESQEGADGEKPTWAEQETAIEKDFWSTVEAFALKARADGYGAPPPSDEIENGTPPQ